MNDNTICCRPKGLTFPGMILNLRALPERHPAKHLGSPWITWVSGHPVAGCRVSIIFQGILVPLKPLKGVPRTMGKP